ncbi:hypothetical protein [Streptomyces sp. NPDC059814]|uniref:hypothetical protein n=1 Tax=Streptomyces sp. NPDC059814 TaxID=3346959 RepID=UPI00365841AA
MAEEIERQEREDDARGPEPEGRFVLRGGRWVRVEQELAVVPSLLPPGYVPVAAQRAEQGSDEIRVRHLMIAAIGRYGSARVGGTL